MKTTLLFPLFVALVLASTLSCHAAEGDVDDKPDYVYVPDVQLNAEGKGTVSVYLNTYVTEYNAFEIDIYLPDGYSIDKNFKGKYVVTFNTEDEVTTSHTALLGDNLDNDSIPYVRIVAASIPNDYIAPGDNKLFSFKISGPPSDEVMTGYLKYIVFAEGSTVETANDHYLPDVEFAIIPDGVSTGVDDVTSDGCSVGDGSIYNLQGIRVGDDLRALPAGLYIRSGRKVIKR